MRKIIALLALLASPAHAADTITISIVSDAGVWSGSASKTFTLSQADMTTFLNWVKASYICQPQPNCAALTTPQALNAWALDFKAGVVRDVGAWQGGVAIKNVTPINPN